MGWIGLSLAGLGWAEPHQALGLTTRQRGEGDARREGGCMAAKQRPAAA